MTRLRVARGRLIGAETEFLTIDQLRGFLNTRINTLEALESQQTPSRSTGFSDGARSFQRSHHAASFQETTCALCSSNHFIMNCKDFRAKTPEQRREVVNKKNLCFNCLGFHPIAKCHSEKRCLQCSGHHHSLLHSITPATSGASSSHVATTATESVTPRTLPHAYVSKRTSDSTVPVLLATALVHVHDHQGKRQLARALVDQGSETSFISDF